MAPSPSTDRGWCLQGSRGGDLLTVLMWHPSVTLVLSRGTQALRVHIDRVTHVENLKAGRDFEGRWIQLPCYIDEEIGPKRRLMTGWTESKVFSLSFCFSSLCGFSFVLCPNRWNLPKEAIFVVSLSQVHVAWFYGEAVSNTDVGWLTEWASK